MKSKSGFTMIEMLVVMGIIAILAGSMMAGFSRITKSAQRSRAQEAVSNVATALQMILQKKGSWPSDNDGALRKFGGSDGGGSGSKGAVVDVAKVFVKYKLLGVAHKGGETDYSQIKLIGVDSCGIVDSWAQAVLKRSKGATAENAGRDLKVPSGGTVKDHVIYYALDEDYDGITEAEVCGERIKVRASAIAWCAGADGKTGNVYSKRSKDNEDNVYSWRRAQEVKK